MAGYQLLQFSIIGAIGFLVDAGTLYFAMGALGFGLYGGRVISYLVAATATWLLNRRFTFQEQRSANWLTEWGRFLAANAVGGLINFTTYACLVTYVPMARALPVLGVAAGSIAGLSVNFVLSRYLVFRGN